MTEIPLNSNLQLSQALSQLTQSAPDSHVARQAIEVIVKQLEGNLISLTPANIAQLKAVLLPNDKLQGRLQNNANYLAKLDQQASSRLQFYPVNDNTLTSNISLSAPLAKSVLSLPAQQFAQLLRLSGPLTAQLNSPATASASNLTPLPTLQASVVSQTAQTLQLLVEGVRSSQLLSLPTNSPLPYKEGQQLSLSLTPKGQNWQLNLSPLTPSPLQSNSEGLTYAQRSLQNPTQVSPAPGNLISDNPLSGKIASQEPPSPAESAANIATKQAIQSNTPQSGMTQSMLISLPPALGAELLSLNLRSLANQQKVEISLPLASLMQQLSKLQISGAQHVLHQLQSLLPEKVALRVSPAGEMSLQVQHPRLAAELPLDPANIDKLTALNIKPKQLASTNIPANIQKLNADAVAPLKVNAELKPTTPSEPQVISQLLNILGENKVDKLAGNTTTTVDALPRSELLRALSSEQKHQLVEHIQGLLRVSQPKAELPASVLNQLLPTLLSPAVLAELSDEGSQQWIKLVAQQIQQSVPQGKEQDANQIRQWLTAPAMPLTAVNLVNPPPSQGLLAGLLSLVQVSLAARLMRNQPSLAERIAQIVPNLSTDKTSAGNPQRSTNEFNQLEQRQQLLRDIGKLLADHQSNKLSNAEKNLQGQDSFYYNLPSGFGNQFKNIELLIKREAPEQQQAQVDSATQTWQLTMKLSLGELGDLLSKARLRANGLSMDFYASNPQVLERVLNYLPLLKRRLQSLGIEVEQSQCQLGKIPTTLNDRPYHIFQTQA